ncbi:MAG TPA: hypothetical protein VLG92_05850 [Candidatus Saccharimonadia bacterium]|nr:hypothetical protein [Candidatus Saccharimonadia bacterium]
MSIHTTSSHELTAESNEARDLLRRWHEDDEPAGASSINYGAVDATIDRLVFGADALTYELSVSADRRAQIQGQHPGQLLYLGGETCNWTPYNAIRAITHHLEPTDQDVVYDLGAGYGTLPIYIGATTNAAAKGVELVHHRVKAARSAIGRLGLTGVEMIEGDVLDHDISDGSVFYMFAPFPFAIRDMVLCRIRDVARERRVRVVMRRMSGDWLERSWLGEIHQTELEGAAEGVVIADTGL